MTAPWLGVYYARGLSASAEEVERELCERFPALKAEFEALSPPEGVTLKYGTAGFRTVAENLDSTFLRMGALAAIRSRSLGGSVVGLMVTASHNPVADNGIKMVDGNGGMLAVSWEAYAQALANAPAADGQAVSALASVISSLGPAARCLCLPGGMVAIGQDTRPHSPHLAALAVRGAVAVGGQVLDCGVLTTPQVHHIVRMRNIANSRLLPDCTATAAAVARGWAHEDGYYSMMAQAYADLVTTRSDADLESLKGLPPRQLVVDAAGGVGALKIIPAAQAVTAALAARGLGGGLSMEVTVMNGVGEGELNSGCGAEFVQKKREAPRGASAQTLGANGGVVSFDGDADRLVYHFYRPDGSWALLDGDKIATLVSDFVGAELAVLGLAQDFSMAVVQTAYANGASTAYLRDTAKLRLDFAKTGVKFVHHVAEQYDIGVYFEANGHGTILMKDGLVTHLQSMRAGAVPLPAAAAQDPERAQVALRRLLALHQLVNQAVGDAISDTLLLEAILVVRGWTVENWDELYADLPSRQSKLPVQDRAVVSCSPDETRALAPPGLQEALDAAMSTTDQGRCFVRPSGTEDVVRVYAEARTQADANALALVAAQAVYDIAGGVGDRPS